MIAEDVTTLTRPAKAGREGNAAIIAYYGEVLIMNFEDEVQQAAKNWAHPAILRIWGIVSTPDYENGEPVLRSGDIEMIADAILEINAAFNKPEIKALARHMAKSEAE